MKKEPYERQRGETKALPEAQPKAEAMGGANGKQGRVR